MLRAAHEYLILRRRDVASPDSGNLQVRPALETSTSHRVTESSGDSTRFGHVGVHTRVTPNGPQRLENETCAIILPDPVIRAESRSDASASDRVGVTIVAPAALTIVRQPLDLGTSAHPGALALAERVIRHSESDTRTRVTPECGTRVRHPFAGIPHTRVYKHPCVVAGVHGYTHTPSTTSHTQLMPRLHPPAIARGAAAVHDADGVDTYQPATSPADDVAAHIHRPRSSSTLFSVAGGVSSFEYADADLKSSVNTVTGVLLPRLRGLTRPAGYPWRRLKVVLHKHGRRLKVVRHRHYCRGSGNALAEVVVVVCLHGCLGTGTRGPKPNTRTRVSTHADTLPGTGKHSTPGYTLAQVYQQLDRGNGANSTALTT
ncbi:hypothetical protein BDZ89DRAFT_1193280 [Hymenopellis radicata]|nr:hypothetical protein BDZ89DRAFT_1193280 [Hymenopellis radicata]